MKTGLLLIMCLLSSMVFAQTIAKPDTAKIYRMGMDKPTGGADSLGLPSTIAPVCPKPQDYCTLEKGKMFCVRNSILEPVDRSLTLPNGTMVLPGGKVKTKEGKTWQLKNGDRIDMNGNKIIIPKSTGKEESPKESRK